MIIIRHRTLPAATRDAIRSIRRDVHSVGRDSIFAIQYNTVGQAIGAAPCGWIDFTDSDGQCGRLYYRGRAELSALRLAMRGFRFA